MTAHGCPTPMESKPWKDCPECSGKGEMKETVDVWDGGSIAETRTEWVDCPTCEAYWKGVEEAREEGFKEGYTKGGRDALQEEADYIASHDFKASCKRLAQRVKELTAASLKAGEGKG